MTFTSLHARLTDSVVNVPTLADLPTDAPPGAIRYVVDQGAIYVYSGTTWAVDGGVTGPGGGPGASTDNAAVRWNGTTGSSLQNSGIIIDDLNNITGVNSITAPGMSPNKVLFTDGSSAFSTGSTTSTELGYLTGVLSPIQTQFSGKQPTGNYITALTGDVTAAGPGSSTATVALVGGASAANVASATSLALAATDSNTASTIVRRDASGNFTMSALTASTVNKVTITAPATAATLTIANNKTFTASNTLTLTGTDGSSVAFGTGGTVTYTSNNLSVFAATTSAQLAGVISDETGSGLLVFATSPSLTTPVLGVATATTINKVTLTTPATGSTLTIVDGKTLTASNTLTFTGTDGSSVAFGTGGTATYTSNNLSVFAATTSAQLAGVISDETGTGALVFASSPVLVTPNLGTPSTLVLTNATGLVLSTGTTGTLGADRGGTGIANNAASTLTISGNFATTLTVSNTTSLTLPTAGTLATLAGTETFTNKTLTSPKLNENVAVTSTATQVNYLSAATGTTGTTSTNLVYSTSPSLTTPTLGVASATTINKVTLTTPATGSTLTIADGKTLTMSNTLTFTGTDTSSVAFGTGGTVAYTANKLSVFAATTSSELAGVISDETGSGLLVFATSPTLTTPTLGIASATTINKVTLTTPATGSTLTVADGKTLTASNTLTFTGTDGSSAAFGTGGTVAYTANKLSVFAATSSSELAGVISDETGSGALVFGTAPTIAGGSITALTTLALRDTSAAFDLTLAATSNTALTAGRTLTFNVVNASRTVKLTGNLTTAADFITSGANSLTLTTTGSTNVTLPTSGTLATNATALAATTGLVSSYYPVIQGAINDLASGNNYTVTTNDGYEGITVTTGSTNTLITLAAAGSSPGRLIWIKKLDTGSGIVVVKPAGSDTIDGAAAFPLISRYDQITLMGSNSSDWVVVRGNVGEAANPKLLGDITATAVSGTVTITAATPAVLTKTAHGFVTGDKIYLTNSAAPPTLPTSLTQAQTYYVTNAAANTFNISTTLANAVAGTKISTNGDTQAGTHTVYGGGLLPSSGTRGTLTNDNATAAYVGEVLSQRLGYNSADTLTTSTTTGKNITNCTITLTPGDWDVRGAIHFECGGTLPTAMHASISATSATIPNNDVLGAPTGGEYRAFFNSAAAEPFSEFTIPIPPYRVTVAAGATQQLWLVARAAFAGTASANGYIEARRAR